LREAAEVLRLSVDAVRKRVKRGTLESERGPDGRVYVFLDDDQESGAPIRSHDTDRLISTLQEQLRLEREAHAEARRLLAAALERIPPQLEAPADEPEVTDTVEASPEADRARSPGVFDILQLVTVPIVLAITGFVVSTGGFTTSIISAITGEYVVTIISAIIGAIGAIAGSVLSVYVARRIGGRRRG
jgi:hypothetical protein